MRLNARPLPCNHANKCMLPATLPARGPTKAHQAARCQQRNPPPHGGYLVGDLRGSGSGAAEDRLLASGRAAVAWLRICHASGTAVTLGLSDGMHTQSSCTSIRAAAPIERGVGCCGEEIVSLDTCSGGTGGGRRPGGGRVG